MTTKNIRVHDFEPDGFGGAGIVPPDDPPSVALTESAWTPIFTPRAFDTIYQNATSDTMVVSMAAGVVAQGNKGGRIVFETCPNNSFGGDTHEIDTIGCVYATGGTEVGFGTGLIGLIPPGHYYRYRKVNIGTAASHVFNSGYEMRLELNGDRTDVAYATATTAGLGTSRQNTEADPIWLSASASIVCDAGEDGKLELHICPDNAFGADTRIPSVSRLKINASFLATVTLHEGLKAIVPPGYYYKWVATSTTGSPTVTITGNNESTLVLTGFVTDDNYTSGAYPGMDLGRTNASIDAKLVSIRGGQVSDPGENGHLYQTIAENSANLSTNYWDVPYNATRNANASGGDLTHESTLLGIVPGGHIWKYRSSTTPGFSAPTHQVTGDEFTLLLTTGESEDADVATVNVVAAAGSTETLTSADIQDLTLDANCTLTFPAATAGAAFTLILRQDATGGRTITWPSVKWTGGAAPTLTATASAVDAVSFLCSDGTNWLGFPSGYDLR